MTIAIAHDPILPPDRFAAIVQAATLRAVAFTSAAIDAFGAIRIRSLMERHGLVVAVVTPSPGCPEARRAMLAHILSASGTAPTSRLIPLATLSAQGATLASVAASVAPGSLLQLEPAAWLRMAEGACE